MSLTKQDKQDIAEIVDEKVGKAVSDLATIISDFATNVDQRFEQVDQRFEQVDKRFEQVDKRFASLELEIKQVKKDVSNILGLLDSIESDVQLNSDERAVMGMQLSRVHDWIEKTALKVGVEFTH